MKLNFMTLLLFGVFSTAAFAAGPCRDKAEGKHKAHQALHECIKTWAQDRKPTDADPTDDCSAKLTSFVQAARDLKACRVANKK